MTTLELASSGFKIEIIPLTETHKCIEIVVESNGVKFHKNYTDLTMLDTDTGVFCIFA